MFLFIMSLILENSDSATTFELPQLPTFDSGDNVVSNNSNVDLGEQDSDPMSILPMPASTTPSGAVDFQSDDEQQLLDQPEEKPQQHQPEPQPKLSLPPAPLPTISHPLPPAPFPTINQFLPPAPQQLDLNPPAAIAVQAAPIAAQQGLAKISFGPIVQQSAPPTCSPQMLSMIVIRGAEPKQVEVEDTVSLLDHVFSMKYKPGEFPSPLNFI